MENALLSQCGRVCLSECPDVSLIPQNQRAYHDRQRVQSMPVFTGMCSEVRNVPVFSLVATGSLLAGWVEDTL
ncbi:unnamed protein product [Tuber melanosporum]|uniref:(Perigord truffle) hypothetical protein n=1 Tax=Tuber melanosporum (strain Mel28) TaxID=656061 RepID=D5GHN1_TUBMM|nr:uncharacterized protein GSTUM_00008055001 [Tuber melanosporum]CAZ84061.1 unnamed protein product [Tuber melanosporum]